MGLRGTIGCAACAVAKSTTKPLPKKEEQHKPPLELDEGLYSADLRGPFVRSRGGAHYVLGLLHCKTGYLYTAYLKTKRDVTWAMPQLVVRAENHGFTVATILRTDQGREFVNKDVDKWLAERNIKHQLTAPSSSVTNMVERQAYHLGERQQPGRQWPSSCILGRGG